MVESVVVAWLQRVRVSSELPPVIVRILSDLRRVQPCLQDRCTRGKYVEMHVKGDSRKGRAALERGERKKLKTKTEGATVFGEGFVSTTCSCSKDRRDQAVVVVMLGFPSSV